jgi:hypothetical protein
VFACYEALFVETGSLFDEFLSLPDVFSSLLACYLIVVSCNLSSLLYFHRFRLYSHRCTWLNAQWQPAMIRIHQKRFIAGQQWLLHDSNGS